MNSLDIAVFLGILIISVYVGLKGSQNVKTEVSYLLADRKTGFFALVATLVMTEFNPSTLVGFSSVGYFTGVWELSLPFVFLIGLLFYTFTVAKKWKRLDASSVAELFTLRYGEGFGKLASTFLLIALLGFSANYIKSMQILFKPWMSNFSDFQISFILVMLVAFITLRGGLVAIIKTDIWSFIATLIFIPMLYIFSIPEKSIYHVITIQEGQSALPPNFVLSLIMLTMFTYIAAPWYGQKIFSAKSESVAFYAVGAASILVFLLYSFPILAVYNLKMSGIIFDNSEGGVPYIIKNLFPIGLKGFGYIVIFLAGITTLSGVWSAMVTMILSDLLNKKIDHIVTPKRSIYLTLIIIGISLGISEIFIDKILDKLILANIPIAALSFGLLGAFYYKKTSRVGVIASMFFGFIWGIFCYVYFGVKGNYTYYWGVIGIPLIFIIGITFSLLFPPSQDEKQFIINFNKRMNSA